MSDAIRRYFDAATGFGELTKKRAEAVARQLVKQGEAASDQVGDLVDDLLDRQRKNREAIVEMVRAETQRAVRLMGLATSREVERLETELAELKKELSDTRAMTVETQAAEEPAGGKTTAKAKTAKAKTAKAKTAPKTSSKKKAKKTTRKSKKSSRSEKSSRETT